MVDDVVKAVLSINGFKSFGAFKGLKIDDEILKQFNARINKLKKGTTNFKWIEMLTEEDPENYELTVGASNSIKNLFQKLNAIESFPDKVVISHSKQYPEKQKLVTKNTVETKASKKSSDESQQYKS